MHVSLKVEFEYADLTCELVTLDWNFNQIKIHNIIL